MKIVVAIDSFKGSMTSLQAGEAARQGILKADPLAEVVVRPLADGGEGTVDALVEAMNGRLQRALVTGPLGEKIEASYGILEDGVTAVMEMSAAAGITLVPEDKRNPLFTTTYGLGELIKDAINRGCRHFIIGIGGSATNDGGIGMLQALGYELLDSEGRQVRRGATGLSELVEISDRNALPELNNCEFRIACDVNNPLCGNKGCSHVFGPQKGADEEMIKDMDVWLENYSKLTALYFGKDNSKYPGAGAAGGLGFAFISFIGAKLEPGIQIVMEESQLDKYIKEADLVITGEGKIDDQTINGKAPIGVAKLAKKYDKRVIGLAGLIGDGAALCVEHGIDQIYSINEGSNLPVMELMKSEVACYNMTNRVAQIIKMLK